MRGSRRRSIRNSIAAPTVTSALHSLRPLTNAINLLTEMEMFLALSGLMDDEAWRCCLAIRYRACPQIPRGTQPMLTSMTDNILVFAPPHVQLSGRHEPGSLYDVQTRQRSAAGRGCAYGTKTGLAYADCQF